MNKKGFIHIISIHIILIAIIAAFVGTGVYVVSMRQMTSPTPSLLTPSPTPPILSPTPTITSQSSPIPTPILIPVLTPQNKTIDFSQFEKICAYSEQYRYHPEQYRMYQCEQPLSEFHCNYFLKPSDHFAWLEPMLPMITCKKSETTEKIAEEGVYRVESMSLTGPRIYVTDYATFRDGEFILIRSINEFKNMFAPVQTKEEALAFVEALNRGILVFDTTPLINLKDGKYHASKLTIDITSASETNEGFIVNAYTDFGTCSDAVYRKTLLVKTSGEIEEKNSTLIWESERKPRCVF